MKKVVVGALAASLVFSQGLGIVDAKGEAPKKPMKVDKDKNGIPDDWQAKYHLGYGKPVATKDNDKDGLNNIQEYQLNLNPISKNTDKDKLLDGQEDNDKDGLMNQQELQAKLSPLTADTDKDGVGDAEEDNDSDELNTKEEFAAGTNPIKTDSDKDGLADGEEDEDKDELENSVEFDLQYNPNKRDSDKDGLLDGEEDKDKDELENAVEVELGYNPNDSDSDDDGLQDDKEDFDGDGVSNKSEVEEIEIELVDLAGLEFELEYEISKEGSETKVRDEIGIENSETIVKRLDLTPYMKGEELVDQVKQVLGVNEFAELEIKVEFAGGQGLEAKREFEGEDQEDEDRKEE